MSANADLWIQCKLTFTDEEMKRIDVTCPVKNDAITQRFCDMICDYKFICNEIEETIPSLTDRK